MVSKALSAPIGHSADIELDIGYSDAFGRISGILWDDVDEDGIRDEGESRLEGVKVKLWDLDEDRRFGRNSAPV